MAFQVKFGGSQSQLSQARDDLSSINTSSDDRGGRGRGGGGGGRGGERGGGGRRNKKEGGGPHGGGGNGQEGGGENQHRGGNDRGGRGRGRGGERWRGRGRDRQQSGNADDGNDEGAGGSGESDGGSSITSEGGGRGRRRGGRGGRRGGGRGGGGGGDRENRHEAARGEDASRQDAKPGEVHIHYNITNYTPGGQAAHPPPGTYQGYPGASPLYPGTGYPPPPNFQPPPSYGLHTPVTNVPPAFAPVQQPYSYRSQVSHPPPPLLPDPPRQPFRPPAKPVSLFDVQIPPSSYNPSHGGVRGGHASGSERGSRQNLNQKDRGSRQNLNQKEEERGGAKEGEGRKSGNRPRGDNQREKESTEGKATPKKGPGRQEQGAEASSAPSEGKPVPELNPDEWIKVFYLLLKQFQGRTKLGTLLSQKGDLFKNMSHEDAANWLRQNNRRFLTFEKEGKVKFVSITFKEARTCFKYRKHNTDKCENEHCPFFHVCRDFIAGCCPRQRDCHFNHNFHTRSNAKVCTEAGLQTFTEEEIRTIVSRSTPAVCLKFQQGGLCNDECPDLHVCAKYIRGCCDKDSETCPLATTSRTQSTINGS